MPCAIRWFGRDLRGRCWQQQRQCLQFVASRGRRRSPSGARRTPTPLVFLQLRHVRRVFLLRVDITSAWYTSNTATNTISGTSMASPHVAGAAALYLATDPAALPATVHAAVSTTRRQQAVGIGSGSPTGSSTRSSAACRGYAAERHLHLFVYRPDVHVRRQRIDRRSRHHQLRLGFRRHPGRLRRGRGAPLRKRRHLHVRSPSLT